MDWNAFKDFLGILGFVVGVVGLFLAFSSNRKQKEQEKRYEFILQAIDNNIDKKVTKEEIKKLSLEANKKAEKVLQLDRKIKYDIPVMAQRTFTLEQLQLARDNVVESYKKWQSLQNQFPLIENDDLFLPPDVQKAVEEFIQPEYIRREKIANWQIAVGILGSLTAIASLLRGATNGIVFNIIISALTFSTLVSLAIVYVLRLPPNNSRQFFRRRFPTFLGVFLTLLGIGIFSLVSSPSSFLREWDRPLYNKLQYNSLEIGCWSSLVILLGISLSIWAFQNQKQILKRINLLKDSGRLSDALEAAEIELTYNRYNYDLAKIYFELLFENDKPEQAAEFWFKRFVIQKSRTFSLFSNKYSLVLDLMNHRKNTKTTRFSQRLLSLYERAGLTDHSFHEEIKRRLRRSQKQEKIKNDLP